ncbi:MAG: prolipoprotein diacylglyceryl transferase [Phycisphaerales bacterium]
MTLAAWLHDFSPIALRLGPLTVRWYGLSYLAGFAGGWLLLRWLARRGVVRIAPQRVADAILLIIVGVVVGGRLGYVLLYRPSLLWSFTPDLPWWGALAIHEGGMASHGGMIGVVIAAWLIARGPADDDGVRHDAVPVRHVLDAMCLIGPLGLFFGRIANFVNGELLGRIVADPGAPAPWWAVRFPQELVENEAPVLTGEQARALQALIDAVRRPGDSDGAALDRLIAAVQAGVPGIGEQLAPVLAARHPSQLYQAAAEGVVVGAVVWFVGRRPRVPGVVGCWFLISYGVLRVVTEFWRLPDAHLMTKRPLGLSRGQWLSLVMVAVGLAILVKLVRSREPRLGGWATTRPPVGGDTPPRSADRER